METEEALTRINELSEKDSIDEKVVERTKELLTKVQTEAQKYFPKSPLCVETEAQKYFPKSPFDVGIAEGDIELISIREGKKRSLTAHVERDAKGELTTAIRIYNEGFTANRYDPSDRQLTHIINWFFTNDINWNSFKEEYLI